MMWCVTRVAVVVLSMALAVGAEPVYPQPSNHQPCYPRIEHVTQYKTQVVKVPEYKTQYRPHYVTVTQVLHQTKYVPQYHTQYQTKYVPQYHTATKTIHTYSTVCPKPAYGYH